MRIVAGKHRSRTLLTPKTNVIRPTSDKTRQAVFNMLNARALVVDSIVIDAFCGTGALGLEALSQGAKYCTFFDKHKDSISLTKDNIQNLGEGAHSAVIMRDATKLGQRPDDISPATLVFIDPPYDKGLVVPTIEALQKFDWLAMDAYFVIETSKDENLTCPLINIDVEKLYGDTKISLASLQ